MFTVYKSTGKDFFFLDSKVGWHFGRQPNNKEPTVKLEWESNMAQTLKANTTKNNKTTDCLEIINKQSKRSTHAKERCVRLHMYVISFSGSCREPHRADAANVDCRMAEIRQHRQTETHRPWFKPTFNDYSAPKVSYFIQKK